MHRGNGDMLRWITRFQLSVNRMQEAWNDTYIPIMDPNNAEVRAFVTGLPDEEQAELTPEQAMERANNRLKDQHARTIPITPNLVALIFVSLSDLTQDQRQVLTSLMAHRNRVLADYNTAELREVYLEIFCTTKTTVDNPLLAPSGHGGRKTFLVIEEGYLDGSEGYWVEDEDDGAEGFLEADEDAFWIYDEENYSWFQRRFQGRRMKRGFKGRRKGKGKGGKGSSGKRFFKRKKGSQTLPMTIPMLGKRPMDSGRTVNGKISIGMTGPGMSPRSHTPQREKERKERREKARASLAKMEKMGSPERMDIPNLPRPFPAVLLLLQPSFASTSTP